MRTPLVLGNWKMHGSQTFARALAEAVRARAEEFPGIDLGVCPPYVMLPIVAKALDGSRVALGAQNVSEFGEGAYTGEISAGMLNDLGCLYALVGHSERRQFFAETPGQVVHKLVAANAAGLVPVLCVGETLAERQAGATGGVIESQLQPLLEHPRAEELLVGSVIAYEPVWAIGTGETASPEQAQTVHRNIRELLAAKAPKAVASLRILYGGSVKPGNAAELFAMPDIDGGLIGGAALKAEDFCAIAEAAAASKRS
jgi:triosephosphate isomerase